MADLFLWVQITFFGIIFLIAWRMFSKSQNQSFFKLKEADRKRSSSDSKFQKDDTDPQLLLPGINIDAPPHEILGIPKEASKKEIITAYKNLMKRFHPDRLGPSGSSAWNDGQKLAVAINEAKNTMLKNVKS